MSKGRWTIDVCRTCHKKAQWPFCEHRDQGGDWSAPVVVTGTLPAAVQGVIYS